MCSSVSKTALNVSEISRATYGQVSLGEIDLQQTYYKLTTSKNLTDPHMSPARFNPIICGDDWASTSIAELNRSNRSSRGSTTFCTLSFASACEAAFFSVDSWRVFRISFGVLVFVSVS